MALTNSEISELCKPANAETKVFMQLIEMFFFFQYHTLGIFYATNNVSN